jgi:hypothetical protein
VDSELTSSPEARQSKRAKKEESRAHGEDGRGGSEGDSPTQTIAEGAIAECWWDSDLQLDSWYYEHWYGADFEQKGHGTAFLPTYLITLAVLCVLLSPLACVSTTSQQFDPIAGRGGWRVLRVRTDKETPNVDWVAKKVWESITQCITLTDILAAVGAH